MYISSGLFPGAPSRFIPWPALGTPAGQGEALKRGQDETHQTQTGCSAGVVRQPTGLQGPASESPEQVASCLFLPHSCRPQPARLSGSGLEQALGASTLCEELLGPRH